MERDIQAAAQRRRLRLLPPPDPVFRVADVAIFYGERGGGIHTYLEAKADYARRTGAFEHHLVIPGRPHHPDSGTDAHRHEHRSLRLAASNGYRIPLGTAGLQTTLRSLAPDVVLLHDPYWAPRLSCRSADSFGAIVVAVPPLLCGATRSRDPRPAGGLQGGAAALVPPRVSGRRRDHVCRRPRSRRAAVGNRPTSVRPGPGVQPAAGCRPRRPRDVCGPAEPEKGVRDLLEATAPSPEPWQLKLIGTGVGRDVHGRRPRRPGARDRAGPPPDA